MAEKPKRIWDNFVNIAEVQKTDSIKFVVSAAVRDGVRYVNIREFYFKKSEGVWKPGRDGITIPLQYPIKGGTEIIKPFAEFAKAINMACDYATTMELMDEEHAVWSVPKGGK